MGKIKDLSNLKFNRLHIIEFSHLDREKGLSFWKCKCDCGNECVKCGYMIKNGKIKSCGCLAKEVSLINIKDVKLPRNEKIYKDGKRHPAYVTWLGMKRRCYGVNCKEYRWYGAKGIKVCSEWINKPDVFIEWADKNGYQKGLCIDRIDVNKDYSPENCHFISKLDNLKKIRSDNLKNGFKYSRNRVPQIEGIFI